MATPVAATLARWIELANARYPGVSIEAEQLARHLERLGIAVAGDHPHAADVCLACACVGGDPASIAVFDRELMPVVTAAAGRLDRSPAFADEVMQEVRERLLTASTSGESRLAAYTAQGPLRAYVRIVAMRAAMNMLRNRRRDLLVDDEAFFDRLPVNPAETQREARARYGHACSDALRDAFGKLTARERNLLRMHHLHGLTVDELAPTLRVHRATVARWIAAARERLLTETRAGLQERLAVGTDTADSILRELEGQIDISVTRLLASE